MLKSPPNDGAIMPILKTSIIIILLTVALSQYVTDRANKEEEIYFNQQSDLVKKPDPGRKVHSWDWDNNKFIYMDNAPVIDRLPNDYYTEPLPDYYVKVIGSTSSRTPTKSIDGTRTTIDGKDYIIRQRGNGDLEFELIN